MKKQILFFYLIFHSFLGYSQDKVTLSGTVIDSNNNESLIGVVIEIPVLKISTITNEYGFRA